MRFEDVFTTTEGCGPTIIEIMTIMTEIEEYDSRWFYNANIGDSRKKEVY